VIRSKRVNQVYRPIKKNAGLELDPIFNNGRVYFYSLGRWALFHGLQALGLEAGDSVLLPEFICRDLLAPLNKLGLKIHYYSLDKNLNPQLKGIDLPVAKAIIAVNYFGFACDLSPFREYCKHHQAFLIEDNAHGFLSKDPDGNWLGCRGDLGIFSFRKTFPLSDGAALYFSKEVELVKEPMSLAPREKSSRDFLSPKELIRNVGGFFGPSGIQLATKCLRLARKVVSGKEISSADHDDPAPELEIPTELAPLDMKKYLSEFDSVEETAKRLELFNEIGELLKGQDCRPLHSSLPSNCVPYSFAFFSSDAAIGRIKEVLRKKGLECFNWPELPLAVRKNAPDIYNQLWLVRWVW
jgi:hypothetical protein